MLAILTLLVAFGVSLVASKTHSGRQIYVEIEVGTCDNCESEISFVQVYYSDSDGTRHSGCQIEGDGDDGNFEQGDVASCTFTTQPNQIVYGITLENTDTDMIGVVRVLVRDLTRGKTLFEYSNPDSVKALKLDGDIVERQSFQFRFDETPRQADIAALAHWRRDLRTYKIEFEVGTSDHCESGVNCIHVYFEDAKGNEEHACGIYGDGEDGDFEQGDVASCTFATRKVAQKIILENLDTDGIGLYAVTISDDDSGENLVAWTADRQDNNDGNMVMWLDGGGESERQIFQFRFNYFADMDLDADIE